MRMRQIFAYLCLASMAFAADTTPATTTTKPSDNEPSAEELQTIRKILELPPERLARVRAALERLERMPPEARKEYAASLEKLESASPDDRRKMFKDIREKAGFNGRVLERYLKSLPPEKAKEENARIRAMSPEKRTEFLHSLAEKFGPEMGKGKNDEGSGKHRKFDDANKQPTETTAPATPAPATPVPGA